MQFDDVLFKLNAIGSQKLISHFAYYWTQEVANDPRDPQTLDEMIPSIKRVVVESLREVGIKELPVITEDQYCMIAHKINSGEFTGITLH